MIKTTIRYVYFQPHKYHLIKVRILNNWWLLKVDTGSKFEEKVRYRVILSEQPNSWRWVTSFKPGQTSPPPRLHLAPNLLPHTPLHLLPPHPAGRLPLPVVGHVPVNRVASTASGAPPRLPTFCSPLPEMSVSWKDLSSTNSQSAEYAIIGRLRRFYSGFWRFYACSLRFWCSESVLENLKTLLYSVCKFIISMTLMVACWSELFWAFWSWMWWGGASDTGSRTARWKTGERRTRRRGRMMLRRELMTHWRLRRLATWVRIQLFVLVKLITLSSHVCYVTQKNQMQQCIYIWH